MTAVVPCMRRGCTNPALFSCTASQEVTCSMACHALRHVEREEVRLAQRDSAFRVPLIVPIKVARVIDGDTVVDTENVHYRLEHIDAPEKKQQGGPEATQHLRAIIDGAQLMLDGKPFKQARIGAIISGHDRYGRVLAELVLLEVPGAKTPPSVNEMMVQSGWAWAYDRKSAKEQYWRDLEAKARSAKRGLWGLSGTPMLPHDFRHQPRTKMAEEKSADTQKRA